ncbi:hypothetical protein GPECTOR_41g692 [Gonium pectorale]|uniref:Uncharacterized protein n=1 Tax=Gonium pectorale TaxID=33097 RepID=A0A150GA52_GONPE|nr:hypothetical protein GPECTOR_41g692 [Gonium pectorale]|eukprot:KXZ46727.1 hypothetical protein GPECTOR_41g692 [Gonium pectorale]
MASAEGPLRVLVTGASEGIGAAIARKFAENGARVAVVSRSQAKLDALIATLTGSGHLALPADLSNTESLPSLVEQAVDALGGLDVVVNNDGVSGPGLLDVEAWQAQFTMQVLSAIAIARAAQPALAASGRGVLVNMSSGLAQMPSPSFAPYGGAKAAQDMLTKTLALQWAPSGIRVVGVAPGPVHTPGLELALLSSAPPGADRAAVIEGGLKYMGSMLPLGRVGQPSEVADAVYWLAASGGNITGVILPVDGGALLTSAFSAPTK